MYLSVYHFTMKDSADTVALLFSYGTLRDEAVQMANFGRKLVGRPDSLPGYTLAPILIRDAAVVALSGMKQHTIAESSAIPADEVPGTVFEVTTQELTAADRYEVVEYSRILVTLKSGARAWVYVRA
jgi:Gamma-glutamyl cyclotransferase, AIG2-like